MKKLITGVTGFIGSNLLERLLDKESVVGIDKNFDRLGYVNYLTKHKLPQYPCDINRLTEKFQMIWDNIKHLSDYSFALENIDTIYHLAAASDIKKSLEDPSWDLVENVIRTHDILELMRKKDIENIIFTSTSVVHGLNAPQPVKETGIDFKPISQYAASKVACEVFIHAYSHVYGIKGWIFRFGNVVGKHQHRGVIYDFIKKLKEDKKKLEILGNGNQIKSYVHVSDCIDALLYIPKHDKNKGVEVYNIATYDQVKVSQLADIVCDELKIKPKYKYGGGTHGWVGDVPQVILSIDKALKTGWKPKYKCEKAIRLAVRELNE